MSSAASNSALDIPDYSAGQTAASAPRHSFWRQVWIDTFKNKRARYSSVWIVVVLLCAVFAPFLASSHPLLLKTAGKWSSPLLRHLTWGDIGFLVAFVAGVALLLLKQVPARPLIFAGIVLITTIIAFAFVKPPEAVVYSQYREDARVGLTEWALHVPIPYSPLDYQRDREDARLEAPTRRHYMGTDSNGADVFSRLIHAARIALSIGFIATVIEVLIGIVVGGFMGYFMGRVDLFGMRFIEIVESIPTLFLLIMFTAFYERNLYMMMVIIGVTGWTGNARFIRGEFIKLRNQDFVQAARAAGLPLHSILFRHMLPNGITPVLISASFGIAAAILYESTLSFLGLGLIEEPSWGGMLDQARNAGRFIWWLTIYPGLAIFLTVLSYNLVGESMRDALDPKLRGVD